MNNRLLRFSCFSHHLLEKKQQTRRKVLKKKYWQGSLSARCQGDEEGGGQMIMKEAVRRRRGRNQSATIHEVKVLTKHNEEDKCNDDKEKREFLIGSGKHR
ncbi:uncharacterized protein DS421_20g690260 [Arachis hypogaea]|nr:uncharacterized protein DS421_20g690260 [Arachis hypogaea]